MEKKENKSQLIRFSDGSIESFYGSAEEAERYARQKAGKGTYVVIR